MVRKKDDSTSCAVAGRHEMIVGFGGARTSRIAVLDALRGAAILLVLLYHFQLYGFGSSSSGYWGRLYAQIAGVGWTGVDLFFVLSGFLITGILYDSRASAHYYLSFYSRRTLRIFPLYYATLALFFWVIPAAFEHPSFDSLASEPSQPAAWLYVLNWRIGLNGWRSVSLLIGHFWSLAIEEQFYCVWPMIVRLLERRRRIMGLCVALVFTAFVLRLGLHLADRPAAAYVLTFCRMDALAIGAFLALAARDQEDWRRAKASARWLVALAVLGLAAVVAKTGSTECGNVLMDTAGFTLLGLLYGGVLTIALSTGRESAESGGRLLRILQFFGKYSYCLYIFHQPVIVLLAGAGITGAMLTATLGPQLAVLVLNGAALALSILIALTSWHMLEKHFLRLKDRPFLKPARTGLRMDAPEPLKY